MGPHNCRELGSRGEFIYLCSRCGGCYTCQHKLIWLDEAEKYMWKCKDRKLRPVINDGKLTEGK